jgi:hypothetical protein
MVEQILLAVIRRLAVLLGKEASKTTSMGSAGEAIKWVEAPAVAQADAGGGEVAETIKTFYELRKV